MDGRIEAEGHNGPQARRSTHNRQKQYFEQKKQRYLASGLVCHDDEKHKQTQYYGNCASLDIASLENLAKLTQECRYNDMTNEHISTCNRMEMASQKKFVSPIFPDNEGSAETKSSIINNDKADKKDVPTDMQLSVFDFLGDYEFLDTSLGRSTREAHVSFSVEGLGKIKTETPVRSPIQLRSPPNIQLTSRMTKSVPHGSPSRCMPNSCDSFVDFLDDKCKFCCTVEERDDAFGGNSFGDKAWDGPSSFLDDNAFDDKTYGVTWKSHNFSVDNGFHRDNTLENFDYDFEDTFLFNKRHLGEMHNNRNRMSDLWQMDSPVSSLNHLPSENENDFKSFIMGRCPGDFGSSNIELFSDPSWSSFHSEDSRKSMSLLSEESCSSSTARGDRTKRPTSELFEDRSRNRNHGTKVHMNTIKNMTNISVTKSKSRKLGKVHEDDIYKDVENINSPNFMWIRDAHPLKGLASVSRTWEPLERSVFEDGCIPDILPSGQRSSDKEFTSHGCKLFSVEDICQPYPTTRIHPRVHYSPGQNESDFVANDFSKAAANISKEQSTDHLPLAEVQRTNTPCTLYCQDIEEMSGIQPTGSNVSEGIKKDATNEVTTCISSGTTGSAKNVERTNVLSEGAKDEEITNAKVSDEVIEKNAEVVDIPGKSLDSAQEILTEFMEIPPKLEIFTRDTEHHKDAGIRLNTKISNRDAERKTSEPELKFCGKEQPHVEQSYEMMLESYVLQLLCVRKVLEASEDNPVKKF